MERKGTFKKGNKGKPKGAVSEKTVFWNQMKDWVTSDGMMKFKTELESLEGREYINAYTNVLEFFQPKLQRTELKGEMKTENKQVVKIGDQIIEF